MESCQFLRSEKHCLLFSPSATVHIQVIPQLNYCSSFLIILPASSLSFLQSILYIFISCFSRI